MRPYFERENQAIIDAKVKVEFATKTSEKIIIATVFIVVVGGMCTAIMGKTFVAQFSLRNNATTTQGTVFALEPQNHQLVRFEYSVAGVKHEGSSGSLDFEKLRPNTVVKVYYDRTNPSNAALNLPDPIPEIAGFCAFMVCVALGVTFLTFHHER